MTKLLTFSVAGDSVEGNSLVAHFAAIRAVECCSAQCGSMKSIEKPARTEIGRKRLHFLHQELRNTISRQ